MSNNPILRYFLIIIASIGTLGVFSIIIWREATMFGLLLKRKLIILLAIGMVLLVIISLLLSSTSLTGIEIFWLLLLRIVYISWVIVPIFVIRDIVSIWYKIPSFIMIGISLLYIGFGLYEGTTIKVTPLSLSSDLIKKEHKIAFISDFHVESIHNRRYIQRIVNHIKSIQPDFVLLGGDLMNTAKLDYVDAFLPFNQLQMPIYAILGNHDHMGDSGAITAIFTKTKIIPLRNTSVSLGDLQIVGIDDKSYRGSETLSGILKQSSIANKGQFTILLSHQPQKLAKLAGYPINLELAGHTHNGQFFPMNWIIRPLNDYVYGEYHLNDKTAFVSQGIGSWWAPIRIGTQSELVLISLVPKH